MSYDVRLTQESQHQLAAILEWWRANRPEAPDLLLEELKRTSTLLATTASLGKKYSPMGDGYRRLLLRRSRFHVYYKIEEGSGEVWIVAIWNSARGRGPRLK